MTGTTRSAALAAAAWLALAGGCSFHDTEPVMGPPGPLPAGEGSPGFLDRMASQTNVSEDDAMRGMLLLVDDEDKAAGFEQRVASLRGRGIVAQRWDCQARRCLTKGRLAYMIYQACKIPGGLMLQLTGPSQRYCLRELQYRGIIAAGTPTSRVGGMEFVAVLTRAAEYIRTGKIPQSLAPTGGR